MVTLYQVRDSWQHMSHLFLRSSFEASASALKPPLVRPAALLLLRNLHDHTHPHAQGTSPLAAHRLHLPKAHRHILSLQVYPPLANARVLRLELKQV